LELNLESLISKIKNHTVNALGWKTKKKIVVIQSDDWGCIRMPNRETYDELKFKNINVNDIYNKFDSIESELDLNSLFDVLKSFKDNYGNHPIFTANCLMANPNFEKIKETGYSQYFYESIQQQKVEATFLIDLWKKGNSLKVFHPQFHGREHLNISLWIKALQEGLPETIEAFNKKCWGIITNTPSKKRTHYLAAFDFDSIDEMEMHKKIIEDGARIFHEIFGFHSLSFIAPNYVWNNGLNEALRSNKFRFIQTQRNQVEPLHNQSKYKYNFHFTGQQSNNGLIYMNRNCFFEPSSNENIDWVNSCIRDIEQSFFWNTPAIISSHRVNFIGSIHKYNSEKNLELLSELIKRILVKWPDVNFMNTEELGLLIENK
jgi:hypothetical protein